MGKPFKTVKPCDGCGRYFCVCQSPPISPLSSNYANLISSLTGFTAAQEYRVAEAIEAGLREQRERGLR